MIIAARLKMENMITASRLGTAKKLPARFGMALPQRLQRAQPI